MHFVLNMENLYSVSLQISSKEREGVTFKTPFRILPPATPPLRSSTSQPGLLTSKDLITEETRNRFIFIIRFLNSVFL